MMATDRESTLLWKEEPLSPSSVSSFEIDDQWLYLDENLAAPELKSLDIRLPISSQDQKPSRAEVASQLLEQLELEYWIKEEDEESYTADWLEEKICIPTFDDVVAPENAFQHRSDIGCPIVPKQQQRFVQQQHLQQQNHLPQNTTTQTLLQEFETVLGGVEACHQVNSTLTPPQTPPPPPQSAQVLVTLQPVVNYDQRLLQDPAFVYGLIENQQNQQQHEQLPQQFIQQQPQQQQLAVPQNYTEESVLEWNAEDMSLSPLSAAAASSDGGDVQQELADVEEYVRSCAEDASPSSPFTSASDNGSCEYDDSSEDPDWCMDSPSKIKGRRGSKAVSSASFSSASSTTSSSSGQNRSGRKPRPYTRPSPEDKRTRKKEQNKNAATRYRQKKKSEIKEILVEEKELIEKNEQLTVKVKDIQREIGYLKGLMRDLCKAKGLIK